MYYTLHLCTTHYTQCTTHYTQCTTHYTCVLHTTLSVLHTTLSVLHTTLSVLHTTLVYYTLHSVYYTLHSVYYTLHLCTTHYTCVLHTTLSVLHTTLSVPSLHSTLSHLNPLRPSVSDMVHSQLPNFPCLSANLTNHDRRYKHSHVISQWETGFHWTLNLVNFPSTDLLSKIQIDFPHAIHFPTYMLFNNSGRVMLLLTLSTISIDCDVITLLSHLSSISCCYCLLLSSIKTLGRNTASVPSCFQ